MLPVLYPFVHFRAETPTRSRSAPPEVQVDRVIAAAKKREVRQKRARAKKLVNRAEPESQTDEAASAPGESKPRPLHFSDWSSDKTLARRARSLKAYGEGFDSSAVARARTAPACATHG